MILIKAIERLANLKKAEQIILEKLKKASTENTNHQVGFVSGPLSASKPLHIIKNFKMLHEYTNLIRDSVNFPVFSALDFFARTILIKLTYQEKDNQKLWSKIIGSGYITDMFMTPGWKESKGAVNEYKTAKKSGVKINFI